MRYLMGIDSGGTKTLGLLDAVAGNGRSMRWSAQVGNTNHHAIHPEIARERIAELIGDLCSQGGIAPQALEGICFAGAGIDSAADRQWALQILTDLGCGGRLLVCSDGLAALAGANGALTGGMVLAGTGSIAMGVAQDGAIVRVGGWGYKLDDGGSAYGIAILGLRAAFEAFDGRGRPTAIGAAMLEMLGLADMEALLNAVYAPDCTPDRIALLARCVCALDGRDPLAVEILDTAAAALARLATTLAANLGLDRVSIGLCGGMLENVKPLSDRVMGRLAGEPHIQPHLPRYSPAEGAMILLQHSQEDELWPTVRNT